MGLNNNSATQKVILSVALLMSLTACSQTKTTQAEGVSSTDSAVVSASNNPSNKDSLEKFNRSIYSFNVGLDNYFLKPVAKGYKAVTPEFVDTSVTNFFSNLGDVSNAINNLLQFKVSDAINDTERFVFNSTFGFAGLLDVASAAGLEKHNEDFGQTLARWGVGSGPYIMLPFLGPSTVRDASAKFTVDRLTDVTNYSDESLYYFALEMIDKRADLLNEEKAFENISNDQYVALRDAWLQRRDYLITDGKSSKDSASDLIDRLESLDDL
ncbi:VacJ family lipoprotein [Cocleimonas flava]|uniref:Phospholipid-binding lipoprotein MlaA n=1 Tax=Cocleimonas flava TaxID=634765 RepID=A0A4R1F534_9GAMM|nr:VacJ family lipoprotein [Cocleimonas flava]TCJ87659.1 phospholipid-binding lipoprotein MlaA [Cocleimonas flava]